MTSLAHLDLPLTRFLLPIERNDARIELDISLQVPFLRRALHVLEDFISVRVELGPIRVWIERKCLKEKKRSAKGFREIVSLEHLHRDVLGHRIAHQGRCSPSRSHRHHRWLRR